MDDIKIDRLDELVKHVEVLAATPETQFDAMLFDDVELQLTRKLSFFLSLISFKGVRDILL